MASFTPTQGRYLSFIHAYTALHGMAPAESEIAAALCVSPPSVNQMVMMLERKSLISRQPEFLARCDCSCPTRKFPPGAAAGRACRRRLSPLMRQALGQRSWWLRPP